MFSPGLPALQQLNRLDRSSPDFHDQLSNALYGEEYKKCVEKYKKCGEEYKKCVPELQDDDLVWLVDYLDTAPDILNPSSPAFRKCLRELRTICGASGVLPTSYTLSSDVLKVGSDPFASGGFGDVYEGTLKGSGVCVKRVRVYTQEGPEKVIKPFCQEAVVWKHLTHPNIVPFLGITLNPPQFISKWMSSGDLPQYIKKHPDADRVGPLFDVTKGLCYLHSCNVIHGDLKGPNILVDDSGHARIADFGLTTITQNLDSIRTVSHQRGQTARWTAPEVLLGGKCSMEADIFSFAMVMVEVFTGGAVPFSGLPSATAIVSLAQGTRPPRPTHRTFTEDLWTLMQRCWDHDFSLRPEVSGVFQGLTLSRLTSSTLSAYERTRLITTIFSDQDQVKMIRQVSGDDAQTFVDVADGVLDSLSPETRRRCLRFLYKICGREALVPRLLALPLCYNLAENPMYNGEFADVWKGRHHGKDVAAKVLRISSSDDPRRIRKRFCREVMAWKGLRHPNVLPLLGVTMTKNRFVIVSEWMKNGDINEFVKKHANANRLELLEDATMGLIYMHEQGIIHGNLRGSNVAIDDNGRACLADTGLLTIIADESTITSTAVGTSAAQWMGPELLFPGKFGLKESNPTRASDCYSLGMVIYEVLSGRTPFAQYSPLAVIWKIMEGERPVRPEGAQGARFTDSIWEMLEHCWEPQPGDRISVKDVLLGLEGNPRLPGSSSNTSEDVVADVASDFSDAESDNSRTPLVA